MPAFFVGRGKTKGARGANQTIELMGVGLLGERLTNIDTCRDTADLRPEYCQ